MQIAYTLGDVARNVQFPAYKEYAANAEGVWSQLKPEFVLDALAVLENYHVYTNGYFESHDDTRPDEG